MSITSCYITNYPKIFWLRTIIRYYLPHFLWATHSNRVPHLFSDGLSLLQASWDPSWTPEGQRLKSPEALFIRMSDG